jgi:hypothetical protein
LEGVVEAAKAAEARRAGDVDHAHVGLVDELFREEQTAGLRHRDRRSAEVSLEESPELALADAEPLRE